MNKKMKELLEKIEACQTRAKAFNEDGESKDVAKAQGEIATMKELQAEYEVEKALYEAEKANVPDAPAPVMAKVDELQTEEKAFVDYCRGIATEKTLSRGANGDIIPNSIANKIIEEVKELSPILSKVTMYHVKGTLSIPCYGKDGTDDVTAAYATEFTDLTAHQGKFTSVDLGVYIVGALAKISKSLINNTDVDVLNFIVGKVAKSIADFLEKELLVGTGTSAMTGATTTTNLKTLTTKTIAGYTADILIDTQLLVPEVYQANACWIMGKDLFTAIRKLKDGDGNYLLVRDFIAGAGWVLLGKPVYISENMPSAATASAVPLLYGDMSGMACKLAKNVEVTVLRELYAAQYAVGITGFVEVDSKIENSQKFVGVKNAAS